MPSTSDQDAFPSLGPARDQAIAWFARLQDSKANETDKAEFADWLAANPAHRNAYDEVERLWQSPALAAALSQNPSIPLRPLRRQPEKNRWFAAAIVVLAVGFTATNNVLQTWQADVATATGEQRRVALADGSALVLNTDSAVKLDYADERRGVTLLSGEAYFEVQADKDRPFVVTTEHGSVRVVGTRFSVKTGAATQVNVASGIVVCSAKLGSSRQLTAGQHTEIQTDDVAPIAAVAADQSFAWLKGRLVFQNQTLADVVAELDRYHPGAIVVAGDALGRMRITGNYKLDNSADLIRTLAAIAGANVTSLSPYLTVLSR